MSNNIVLKAKSVSKFFGTITALNNVDLELNEGEVLGVVGDNGAGKSTLMSIVFGYYQADSGLIKINKKKNIEIIFFNIKEHLFCQHDLLY